MRNRIGVSVIALLLSCGWAMADTLAPKGMLIQDTLGAAEAEESGGESADGGGGNPSDPTAAVKYTDLRYRYLDLGSSADRNWLSVEGGLMINPKFKFTYELHYWDTDLTGSSESDFESAHIKGIYIGKGRRLNEKVGYKYAWGVELIENLGDFSDGTGSGTDQIGPFAAIAWALPGNNTVITLGQYFVSYDEDSDAPDVERTALRVIWLKQLENRMWFKLDDKFIIDHENGDSTSNTVELQLGKMFNPKFGLYGDLLYQTGGWQQYDWGVGVGVRFMY